MTSRILPPAEYPRLAGTELETVWPHLPATAQVLVVEERDQIVGCWATFPLQHVECLWIAPAHRGRCSVARRLWVGMRRLVRALGAQTVITGATDPVVHQLLMDHGACALPGTQFSLRVEA